MEKQKLLLEKVLKKISPYWNLADGFLALLQSDYCDEQTVSTLMDLIYKSMKQVNSEINKDKLQKGIDVVKHIRDMEWKKTSNHDEELDILLQGI